MIKKTEHESVKTVLKAGTCTNMDAAIGVYIRTSTRVTGNVNHVMYSKRGYSNSNFRDQGYRGNGRGRGNGHYNNRYNNNKNNYDNNGNQNNGNNYRSLGYSNRGSRNNQNRNNNNNNASVRVPKRIRETCDNPQMHGNK